MENRRRDSNDSHEFIGEQVVYESRDGSVKNARTNQPAPPRLLGTNDSDFPDNQSRLDHLAVWLPAPLGEQEAMVFTDPERFFRPPYVGVRGWVGVRIDRRPDWTVVGRLVEQAYRMVAPPPSRAARVATSPPPRAARAKRGR